jgi:photosystem II stability/assembly factor-like uncharacterized protein
MIKKLTAIIMLILAVFMAGCSNSSHTQKQGILPAQSVDTPKPVPAEVFNNLSSIKMFNESTGWAISPKAVIRKDHGKWTDASPKEESGNIFGVAAFTDIKTGWVSTFKEGGTHITILRTRNGGKSWRATNINPTEPGIVPTVKTIDFIDSNHGWLAVSYGTAVGSELIEIYQTINGGKTWALIASPRQKTANGIPGGGIKTGLSFIDKNRGWLTGFWYGDTVWLYVTNDSGKTWKQQDIKVPSGYPTEAGAVETWPPMFFGSNTGILPLTFHSQGQPVIFYFTDNKGISWRPTTPIKSKDNQPFIWSFANIKLGFASDHIQLYKTSDAARTWKTIKPNIDFKNVTQIDFVSKNAGWAIGKDIFVKTLDGGLTWKPASE